MNMIKQMVGVQSYYIYKMGFTTTKRPISFVDVKKTQISLKVLKNTNEVKVFSDTGGNFRKITLKVRIESQYWASWMP